MAAPSKIEGIDKTRIDAIWGQVKPSLQKVLDKSDRYTAEALKDDLKTGASQLWVCTQAGKIKCAVVTGILRHPLKTVCLVWLVGGEDMKTWLRHIEVIEAWAKSLGCSSIESQCRPGWERVLLEHEWHKTLVVLEKTL